MEDDLILINPSKEYEKELLDYMDELKNTNSEYHGCGMLEEYLDNYDGWLRKLEEFRNLSSTGTWVKSDVFILVRKSDKRVVGIINLRYYLNEFLYKFGGNIGYNVRPSERRKGYATYQLNKVLEICKENNMGKVLITCDKENIASSSTIKRCGGILENEIVDEDGVVIDKAHIIERYWINL